MSIPEALLSSDAEAEGSVIAGRCSGEAEHRVELPGEGGRGRWGALLTPGLFKEQSSGTRVKSQPGQGAPRGEETCPRAFPCTNSISCTRIEGKPKFEIK